MEKDKIHKVLVVDDEAEILTLVEVQLSDLPFIIIPTSSPAEAIHILKTKEISVLLCDLNMPGIDGNVVLTTARVENPNIISILITGAADQTATIRAINEGGIWKYIAKPWRREELVKMVSDGAKEYAMRCRQQAQLEELAHQVDTDHGQAPVEPAAGEDVTSDRYRLVEVLGEGGAGIVYRAEDQLLDMPVAIKVLNKEFTRNETAEATLRAEARIAMQLSHRHIVRIHNLQKLGGKYSLVMEYVQGRTLRDILRIHETLPLETVLQIVRVCSNALSYAHRHGVLHRDLKPENILLTKDGVLKVIDFGVACLAGTRDDADHVIGTPVYMSPEQICGKRLDARTDIRSLGIIVYELLTGQPPFPRSTTDVKLIANGPRKLPGLPGLIKPVLEKAVAPNPDDRWETVAEFANALTEAAAWLIDQESRPAIEDMMLHLPEANPTPDMQSAGA